MRRDILARLNLERGRRTPVAVVTDTESGRQCLLLPGGIMGDSLPPAVVEAGRALLARDKSDNVEHEGRSYFIHAFAPSPRLIVVGAVHVSQTLAPMARAAGFEVIVVDPRQAFASAERFPGVTLVDEWPDEALVELEPDERTAIVTLTHDPKLDDPALTIALRSPAFYIGSLGSTRTHAKRVQRLTNAGFDQAAIERIHAPIGLDIGAKTPAEIAVSIIAEVIAARRLAPASAAIEA